jgi:hypothetical protein
MAKQLPDVIAPLPKPPGRDSSLGGGLSVAPALREVAVGAVPHEEVGEHEATTRKVANPQECSTPPVVPTVPDAARPRRYQIWHAVVAVVVIVGGIVLVAGVRKRPSSTKTASVPAATPAAVLPATPSVQRDPHAPSQPEPTLPAPGTIHLEIGVEPAEATLTLDDAFVGNRLVVDAPRDLSIHVLKASAPGFLPFSQKFSYASDVRLAIQLRRLRAPAHGTAKLPVAKLAAKSKPLRFEARPLESVRSVSSPVRADAHAPSVQPESAEPGTNLGHPAPRRASKPIDEKDPYAQ